MGSASLPVIPYENLLEVFRKILRGGGFLKGAARSDCLSDVRWGTDALRIRTNLSGKIYNARFKDVFDTKIPKLAHSRSNRVILVSVF